jgi:hypothetical protein
MYTDAVVNYGDTAVVLTTAEAPILTASTYLPLAQIVLPGQYLWFQNDTAAASIIPATILWEERSSDSFETSRPRSTDGEP